MKQTKKNGYGVLISRSHEFTKWPVSYMGQCYNFKEGVLQVDRNLTTIVGPYHNDWW